jgi:hypothetical protein
MPPDKQTIRYAVDRAATLRRRYQNDDRHRHFTAAAMLEQVCGEVGSRVDLGDGWWRVGVVMDSIAGIELEVEVKPGEWRIRLREPAPMVAWAGSAASSCADWILLAAEYAEAREVKQTLAVARTGDGRIPRADPDAEPGTTLVGRTGGAGRPWGLTAGAGERMVGLRGQTHGHTRPTAELRSRWTDAAPGLTVLSPRTGDAAAAATAIAATDSAGTIGSAARVMVFVLVMLGGSGREAEQAYASYQQTADDPAAGAVPHETLQCRVKPDPVHPYASCSGGPVRVDAV